MNLPIELILELSSYLPVLGTPPSSSYQPVIADVSSLAALSRVSRRIRHAVAPALFKSIPLSSERHLHALADLPCGLLQYCRLASLASSY